MPLTLFTISLDSGHAILIISSPLSQVTEVFDTLSGRENPVIKKLAVDWADINQISSDVFARALFRLEEFHLSMLDQREVVAMGQINDLLRYIARNKGGIGLKKLTLSGMDLVKIQSEVLAAAFKRVREVKILQGKITSTQLRKVMVGTKAEYEFEFSGQVV